MSEQLQILITAQNDTLRAFKEINDQLKGLRDRAEQTRKETESLSASLGKVGSSLSSVGRDLSIGITAPLVALGTVTSKMAIDFESSFAGVRKTVTASESKFKELGTGLRDLAKQIPVNVNELNRIAEAAGQLGVETDSILGFTKTMAQLGVATNLSADDAATALARLANITQMPQENFDRLGSTVVALGNNFAGTESEIVQLGLRLAGAGHAVGLAEHEILGLATAISSVGIEAEAGGSAVSRVLINMGTAVSKGGRDLDNFARVAGMSAEQFAKAFKDNAAGAFNAFVVGLSKMKAAGGDVLGTLEAMGIEEIRMRDALLRLSGAGDKVTEALTLGAQAWRENTALTKEAAERFKTTASQLGILWNRVQEVGITLGNSFLPAIKSATAAAGEALPYLQKAAEWFGKLPAVAQIAAIGIGALAAAIGPAMLLLGQFALALKGMIDLFAATSAAGGIFKISLMGIGVVAAGLGAFLVGLGVGSLIREWTGLGKVLDEVAIKMTKLGKVEAEAAANNEQVLAKQAKLAKDRELIARLNIRTGAELGTVTVQLGNSTAVLARSIEDETRAAIKSATEKEKLEKASEILGRKVTSLAEANKVLAIAEAMSSKATEKHREEMQKLAAQLTGQNLVDRAKQLGEALEMPGVEAAVMSNRARLRDLYNEIQRLIKDGLDKLPPALQRVKTAFETPFNLGMGRDIAGLGLLGSRSTTPTLDQQNFASGKMDMLGVGAFELVEEKGVYIWKQVEEGTKKAEKAAFDWSRALQDVAHAFQALGLSAENSLSKILVLGTQGAAVFQNVFDEHGKMKTSFTTQDKIGGIAAGAGTILGAYGSGSVGGGILGGAGAGAGIGAMFGGPVGAGIGAGIGALVGGLAGFFGGKSKDKKEFADLVASLKKDLPTLREQAERFGISLDKALASGSAKQLKAALEQIGEATEAQQKRMAGLGTAAAGLNLLTEGMKFGRPAGDDIKDYYAKVKGEIDAMIKGAGGEGNLTAAQKKELEAKRYNLWVTGHKIEDGVPSDSPEFKAQVSRVGLYAAGVFGGLVAETGDVISALDQIGPTLDALREHFKATGTTGSAAVQQLLGMREVLVTNEGLAQQISGLQQLMRGLGEAGRVTGDMVTAFGADATSQFHALMDGGADANQAFAIMQPTLQQLFEQQKQFGTITDESTLSLLQQAEAMGLVGDDMRTGLSAVVDVLKDIRDAILGIPTDRKVNVHTNYTHSGRRPGGDGGDGDGGGEGDDGVTPPRPPRPTSTEDDFVTSAKGFGPRRLDRDTIFQAHRGEHVLIVPAGKKVGFKSARSGFGDDFTPISREERRLAAGSVTAEELAGSSGGSESETAAVVSALTETQSQISELSRQVSALVEQLPALAAARGESIVVNNSPTIQVRDESLVKTREGVELFEQRTIAVMDRALRINANGLASRVEAIARRAKA